MKKMLLIDANLLLFRSFYAAQAISKTPGNMATHLFLNSTIEIIKDEAPDYIFFAFDAHGDTKRHIEFPNYKANRTKAPQELYDQKNIIQEILTTMKFMWMAKVGDEADDLIATLSEKHKNEFQIVILSEDKDLLQLVQNNVSILQKNRDKSINKKYKEINEKNFYEIYSFFPNQITDYKGIAGDSSDNLIGIKGIGPKTTIELLKKYKTLEGIYKNIDSLKEKQQRIFNEHKEMAFMCKKLAQLNKNVDFNYDLSFLKFNKNELVNEDIQNVLTKHGLKKIWEIIIKM